MKQENVQFTMLMRPIDRNHPCEYYVHHSFYPEIEDALLEAISAWNLDNPLFEGEVCFVAPGFGRDPRYPLPTPEYQAIFRQ